MKTISYFIDKYLDYLESLRQSRYTIRGVRSHLGRFKVYLEKNFQLKTPGEIHVDHLRQWHFYQSTRCNQDGYPLSPTTINGGISSVRSFIDYLAKGGFVGYHLLPVLVFVKVPKHLPKSVLTHAQVKRFLSRIATNTALGTRNRAMFEILYSTGIRAGELLRLNVGDIDFRHGSALINGKGDKQRIVPIGKTAMRYLTSYVKAVRPYQLKEKSENALFLNIDGNRLHYNSFCTIMVSLRKQLKQDGNVSAHTFRRSCTTELLRGGANIYHVKELLGHETLETLRHYSKLIITDLKKTHKKCHPRERETNQ